MAEDTSKYETGELTRLSMAKSEDLIRSQPENYMWTHRRWKHAR